MAKSIASRRERRRQETGERLLDAAVRLFAEQGFAGTTVEAITEAADVGKGTFFNYFPSKEHVFIALAEKQIGKIAAAARAIEPDLPIRDQVRKVVHHIADGWLNSRRLFRTMVGTVATNETLAPVLETLLPQGRGHMLVLMREGQRRGELRDDLSAADLARTLQQFMMGTQLIWSMQRDADLHAWIDQALDMVWRGIAASPVPELSSGPRAHR